VATAKRWRLADADADDDGPAGGLDRSRAVVVDRATAREAACMVEGSVYGWMCGVERAGGDGRSQGCERMDSRWLTPHSRLTFLLLLRFTPAA